MSEPAKPHRTELARRIGYAFSLAGTTAAAVIVNVWPSWHAVPYITDAAEPVIQLINISLLLRIAFNVIFLFLESPVLTAGCDLMSAVIGLAALILMWTTFPFSFPADSGWDATAHLVLAVMTMGPQSP